MAQPIAHYPPTPLHIVIVGAGFGGLTAAIECHFKGHTVTVLERSPEWNQLGDIISIGANAGQILSRYDPAHITDKLQKICMSNDRFRLHTWEGEFMVEQVLSRVPGKPSYNGHRAELHKVLYDYAVSLDIPIRMGKKVVKYDEDEDGAWAVLESGELVRGDVLVAADGLRSKAKKAVLGSHGCDAGWRDQRTGYSIYRAWYDAEECGIGKDPLTKFLMERDTHVGWLGQDVHFLVASIKGGKEISWVATHPVEENAEVGEDEDGEDWMNPTPGKIEEALKLFEGFAPVCKAKIGRAHV